MKTSKPVSNKSRRYFSVGKFEAEIINTFFLFASIPLIIGVGSLYWIFSDLVDPTLGREPIGKNVEVFIIIGIIALIYYFIAVGIFAYRKANKLVGSIPRVIREIDEVLTGTKKTPITLRTGDLLTELIDRINALIKRSQ